MNLQRILLLALGMWVMGAAAAQPVETPDIPGCATVVVQLYRGLVNSIDVALPAGSDAAVAADAIAGLDQHCGWRFDTPVTKGDGRPGARANAAGMYAANFADLSQVAGILLALDVPDRVMVMFLPVEIGAETGDVFDNRFLSVQWRQAGGLRYYDITVKDRGFRTAEEALAVEAPGRSSDRADGAVRLPWVLLLLASLLIGAVAYFVTRMVMLSRERRECVRGRRPY